MASSSHFDQCDMRGATELSPASPHSASGQYSDSSSATYYFECTEDLAGTDVYISCSVGDHCARGQKLIVRVSSSVHAYNESTHEPIIHVTSLSRVMSLMGYRRDSSTGFVYLDRGYQTEEIANRTLEWAWCLEDHCPGSSLDWDASATRDSCIADVNNLAGFLSRKRPEPQIAEALEYYHTALAHAPHHCPTLGYLAELHANQGNLTAAAATATMLCAACGGPRSAAARQTAQSFASANVAWPQAGACVPSPSPPPPALMPPPFPPLQEGSTLVHFVRFTVVVANSIESIDRAAATTRMAAMFAVAPGQIGLELTSASVKIAVTLEAASRSEALSTRSFVESLNSTTASAYLKLSVLQVSAPVMETQVFVAPSPPGVPPPSPFSPPTQPPAKSHLEETLTIALASGGGAIAACWLCISAYVLYRRRRRKKLDSLHDRNERTELGLPPVWKDSKLKDGKSGIPEVLGTPATATALAFKSTSVTKGTARDDARKYGLPFSPAEKLVAKEPRTPREGRHGTAEVPGERQRAVRTLRPVKTACYDRATSQDSSSDTSEASSHSGRSHPGRQHSHYRPHTCKSTHHQREEMRHQDHHQHHHHRHRSHIYEGSHRTHVHTAKAGHPSRRAYRQDPPEAETNAYRLGGDADRPRPITAGRSHSSASRTMQAQHRARTAAPGARATYDQKPVQRTRQMREQVRHRPDGRDVRV